MRNLALLLLSLAASFAGLSQAQEPPGRVGRLAYTQGSVSVYQDPELGWDKAYVNTPITSENSVWTDRGSRAELRVAGVAIRLEATTQLDVSRLDEDAMDASIERGSANIRVRYKNPRERITLETPQARFTIQADGRYRIEVDPDRDESRLTVFAGDARMESQGGRIRVPAGTTVRVFGGPSSSYITERATSDAFDRWADARDREWVDNRSRQYVSTAMTGYEELDRYGQWSQDSDYGAVWFPTRVASDWAPYRHGRWTHVRPWGWTWVDDAPWGYAPFHYGRWVTVGNRWAWSPGQRVERPAWAPALVGWVGGSNWNVSISSGGSAPVVGWYPLAPWERYEPWYRSNRAYTDRLNFAVVRDSAPRTYQGSGDEWRGFNRDRGSTVVLRDVLVDRRPVQSALVQVNVEALRQQQVVAAAQVQQVLPQGNELIRRRLDRNQAPIAAPPFQQAQQPMAQQGQQVQQGQRGSQGQQGQQVEGARPRFGGFGAPAPVAAPANMPPPSAANPAMRGQPAQQQQQQQQGQQQQQQQAREAQERAAREAQMQQQGQLQRQQQEAAARDAQQQQQNQLQRQTREAQQQQERAAREGQQQREAQQRQQQEAAAREAQQQQQNQLQRQTREAQQQQERAAREGQQQREAQQRQQQEAAQREAQQQQQRAAQQLQQQQEQAARAAQQQAQRAAQEAQQAAQRAAQEAQQAAQRAAQEAQQRAGRGGQPQPQPAAQPQPAQQPQANPAARGNRDQQQRDKDEKEKEEKDKKEKKDKEDKR